MDYSTRGFPVLHYPPEFVQMHVHWVDDTIQLSHPVLCPSPPAVNLFQNQGLFQWVSSLRQVPKVLKLQLQHQSFQWIFRVGFLQDWLVWSLCSPGDSQGSCSTPQIAACHVSLFVTNSLSSLILTLESLVPSNHLILCHPLLLLSSIFPRIRVFSNESVLCIKWPKYWSFSFSISPSNDYPGLISFGIDWFDLLAVQRTLESLLQHHSSKASILWRSAFFIVQLSYPYMITEKTIALTRWTFVGKVMYLLFNMLSPGKPHSFFMKEQLDL